MAFDVGRHDVALAEQTEPADDSGGPARVLRMSDHRSRV
jgi:hypothetical protein